jgi:hypothetical protein
MMYPLWPRDEAWLVVDDDAVSSEETVLVEDDATQLTSLSWPFPFGVRNAAPGVKRRRRNHPAVTFAVDGRDGHYQTFRTFEDAAVFAVGLAISNGARVFIDVLVYTPAGARWWAGDDAVERWHDDPDASAFERIEIRANSLGRIP